MENLSVKSSHDAESAPLSPRSRSDETSSLFGRSVSTVKSDVTLRGREFFVYKKNSEPFFSRQFLKIDFLRFKNSDTYRQLKRSLMNSSEKLTNPAYRNQAPTTKIFMEVLGEVIEKKFKNIIASTQNPQMDVLVKEIADSCFREDSSHYLPWVEDICYQSLNEKGALSIDEGKRTELLHQAEVLRCIAHMRKGLQNVVILQNRGFSEKVQVWFLKFFSSKVFFDYSVFQDALKRLLSKEEEEEQKLGAAAAYVHGVNLMLVETY